MQLKPIIQVSISFLSKFWKFFFNTLLILQKNIKLKEIFISEIVVYIWIDDDSNFDF